MSNLIRLTPFLLMILFLSSCSDQNILEKLGFTQVLGYDAVSSLDDQSDTSLEISISYPRPDQETGVITREYLNAISATSREGKGFLARQTELKLVNGQLRSVLFGESLAEKGIQEQIDTLLRDSAVSPRVKIVVVEGRANELIAKDYFPHSRPGQYIHRMLNKETNSQHIPKITLHEFARDYSDDGIDAIAPIIRDNGSTIIVDGIALFQEDQYKMKVNTEQAIIFNLLQAPIDYGEITIDLSELQKEEKTHLLYTSLISKRKVRVISSYEDDQYSVNINLKIQGVVMEYAGDIQLEQPSERRKLEQWISNYIQAQAEQLIKELQKNNVDSIGIGKYVRNSLRHKQWSSLNWREIYPTVKVNIEVSSTIKDYGKLIY